MRNPGRVWIQQEESSELGMYYKTVILALRRQRQED